MRSAEPLSWRTVSRLRDCGAVCVGLLTARLCASREHGTVALLAMSSYS